MKNMKTAAKLTASFSILIVLAMIVGIIGIAGMYSINAADDKLYESNLLAVGRMGEIREELQRQRVYLRDLCVYGGNTQKIQEIEQNMKTSANDMDVFFAAYEKTVDDSTDESAYFNAKQVYQKDFATLKQQMIAAATISSEEAMALLYSPSSTATLNSMVGGFTTAMENNDLWAKKQVDDNTSLFKTMLSAEIAMLVISASIAIFLIVYISGLISKPLITLTAFMSKAGSSGDISLRQEDMEIIGKYAQSRDEVGQCIGSTANFIKHLTLISQELEMVANGDLTVKIDMLSDKDTMGVSMQKMVDNLNGMFGDIRTASDQVSAGAGQVSHGAQELASGSSQQAASVEELSASLTELKDKTDRNAIDSQNAREANGKTAEGLAGSIRSMGEMLEAMKEIDESSQSITRVIKVIEDIARQTNILALNAAVEAARAGQHGKGFAVVAEEVRSLAGKSAQAANETSALIEGSSQRVRQGNEIVARTNQDLETAVQSAQESTRLIEQVAAASVEQARSINEINQGMEQISTVVQANSATAQESAAASEEMSAQAVVMNGIVAKFKLKKDSGNNYSGSVSPMFPQSDWQSSAPSSGYPAIGGKY